MIEVYYMEDDANIAQSVREYLEQRDCRVTVYRSITETRQALTNRLPAVLLVDWNMPDGRGDAFCRQVRQRWKDLPLIFLTVRGDSRDIVSAFQCGADDYVVKPFALNVLHSRILALLRRVERAEAACLYCGSLMLDKEKTAVFLNGSEVVLSRTEYQILLLLMENQGKTVTRQQLLMRVWDDNGNFVNDNTLTVAMKRLRDKLENPACLKTVRSFGYRMEESLLTLSRIDAGTLPLEHKAVDLYTALQLAAENMDDLLTEKNVSVEIADKGCVEILGDLEWTMEAFLNLIKNCMEHSPRGGTVHCAYSENPLYAEILIWDEGEGFCPEDMSYLFERFYRGKRAVGDGIGIGLSLARSIFELQNGTIRACNRTEGGACFEVRVYRH